MSTTTQDRDFKKAIVMDNLPDSMLDEAIQWIASNFTPEDIFDKKQLERWAEGEGYVMGD